MNPRFFEIENEINAHLQAILDLRTERLAMLQSSLPGKENDVPLYFNDADRTIRWNGNSFRLSKKPYLFLQTLWNSPNCRAKIETLERNVWHAGGKENLFVEKHTIFTLVARAQKQLEKSCFPYKIVTVKNFSTKELKGYKLVCAQRTKKCYREGK